MNNSIQEKRQGLSMTQPELSKALQAVEPRADVSMVSRYENGACLPTKEQLAELERTLGAARTELYDAEDLDLLGYLAEMNAAHERTEKEYRSPSRVNTTRKCYRISKQFADALPEDLLQVCGYSSWQSWHDAAIKRLLGEYAARKKALKTKEARTA